MKSTSSYKSLRRRATDLFFTLCVSTDNTVDICNKHRPKWQAIKQQSMDTHTHALHTAQSSTPYIHKHSFGSGPQKWLLLDLLVMGFSSVWRRDLLLSFCLYFSGSRSGKVLVHPSLVKSLSHVCLLRESHNTNTPISRTSLRIPNFLPHSTSKLSPSSR